MSFSTLFSDSITASIPELYLGLSISLLLVYGVVYSTALSYDLPVIVRPSGWMSVFVLVITAILML